jgi:hypothetical protein
LLLLQKIVRTAFLRWHPDKFDQNYSSRIVDAERDVVRRRVVEVSQAITALK